MILKEAIERLNTLPLASRDFETEGDKKALKLGIEALEREQLLRCEVPYTGEGLLPSETEE